MVNEKRLIDANALMDEFRKYIADRHDRERCVSDENCNTCERECLWRRVVKAAPTVDAAPVVHGRWIAYESDETYGPHGSKEWYKCSKCGKDAFGRCDQDEWCSSPILSDYCHNCGAKMDGERREGE